MIPNQEILKELYQDVNEAKNRYENLATRFQEKFNSTTMEFFSSPGRTEIIGNHTDHNGGLILAASISMDTIGAAYPNDSNEIHLFSEGYTGPVIIDLNHLASIPKDSGTLSLVAGMMVAIREKGYVAKGFNCYVSSTVIPAAGVSSSASFEMLICTIVNHFFNQNQMSAMDYAKIGQYAENKFWHKKSGLMDQMACAVGGAILLDFSDAENIKYQQVPFTFEEMGYKQIIVDTGDSHSDLNKEYSAIPKEMFEIASKLGAKRLCDTSLEALIAHLADFSNDRGVLRAIHFFKENERVKEVLHSFTAKNYETVLKEIKDSGDSSWKLLQNCYCPDSPKEQPIPKTLTLSELFFEKNHSGVCRVHGGGFAGVIMCVVKEEESEALIHYLSHFINPSKIYPLSIRPIGATYLAK